MDASLEERIEQFAAEIASQSDSQQDVTGLLRQVMAGAMQKMLDAEMDHHLGRTDTSGPSGEASTQEPSVDGKKNRKNGHSKKTVRSEMGEIEVKIPRDRQSEFEPQLIPKHQRKLAGFDEKILTLYAKGMSTRDIQDVIKELYGVDVSPTLISDITVQIDADVKAWRHRPLSAVWPIVYFDGIVVHVRNSQGRVLPHTIYVALGINLQGRKELLGLWLNETEGAKFWLGVLTDMKNRGLQDIFIACVDGLTGFPEAIRAAYPETKVQLCVVHLVRSALRYVGSDDRRPVARGIKEIYTAPTALAAEEALEEFATAWDATYPMISRSLRNRWMDIITVFEFPPEIRRAISTTNAIESVNSVIRKYTRNRKIYPHGDSALKIIYMAIEEASKKWTMPIRDWKHAINHFAIVFEKRMP